MTFLGISSNILILAHLSHADNSNSKTNIDQFTKLEDFRNEFTDLQYSISGSAAVIKLMVGEAFFAPIYNSLVVAGEAYGGACKVEFGYWTRA